MSRDYTPVTEAELEALRISFTGGDVSSTWIQRLIATVERISGIAAVFQSERPLAVDAATKPIHAEIEDLSKDNEYLRTQVKHAAGDRRAAVDAATKPLHAEIETLKQDASNQRYAHGRACEDIKRIAEERNTLKARLQAAQDDYVLGRARTTWNHGLIEATLRNRIDVLEAKLAREEERNAPARDSAAPSIS